MTTLQKILRFHPLSMDYIEIFKEVFQESFPKSIWTWQIKEPTFSSHSLHFIFEPLLKIPKDQFLGKKILPIILECHDGGIPFSILKKYPLAGAILFDNFGEKFYFLGPSFLYTLLYPKQTICSLKDWQGKELEGYSIFPFNFQDQSQREGLKISLQKYMILLEKYLDFSQLF